jgi:mannose-6-phosphate isomerase-like protein (cupin superfamily)
MPRGGQKHPDIVPIHAAGAGNRSPPVFRTTTKFGAGERCIIERRHDTILYRYISILSSSEIKTYRYVCCREGYGGGSKSMATIIDLTAELSKLTLLRSRTPQTTSADRQDSSRSLAEYRDGAIFATKFTGSGGWERHRKGEEIVYILDGDTTVHLMAEGGPETLELRAGMIAIVPQGVWHRFDAPEGVALMTVTPQPTDHPPVHVEDPRTLEAQPA